MFKFCVQELFTHLHRDAARNIAFGFTNTRGTNYLPVDTLDPLKQLLQRFDDINITLRKDSVYCFDSESFRHLAAMKTVEKSMGQLAENRASWEYSVSEAKRLLDHFAKLPPHDVTSTVNLYKTRFRIVGMTRPMATIADAIRSTILVNQDDLKEFSDISERGKGLAKLLKVKVKTVSAKFVDKPRTTCSHQDCIEHSATGVSGVDGKEILKLSTNQPATRPATWATFNSTVLVITTCAVAGLCTARSKIIVAFVAILGWIIYTSTTSSRKA